MSQITTHVLDTSLGKPAQGIAILLEQKTDAGWKKVANGKTDTDGRIKNLVPDSEKINPGVYRMSFETKEYFGRQGMKGFYPSVNIEFEIADQSHYHVPLLLSPYGYSTYRGS
jgi:5-hydroxyisourate hydrolase